MSKRPIVTWLTSTRRSGVTLVEAVLASTIFALVVLALVFALAQGKESMGEMVRSRVAADEIERMMRRLEERFLTAQGALPAGPLRESVGAGDSLLSVDGLLGLPLPADVLVDAGIDAREILTARGLDVALGELFDIVRGERCTTPQFHDVGASVQWAALGRVIGDPTRPPTGAWDGVSMESFGRVFFRGEGTGFAFRVPTDPTGRRRFVDANGAVLWGATVQGAALASGWMNIAYEVVDSVREADLGFDVNADGDMRDTFDRGRLRERAWDGDDPGGQASSLSLCPPLIVQEQCNWGGDLDGDGFDDPLFLWTPESGRLRIRLFFFTGSNGARAQVERLESVVFLRNESE